MKHFRKKRVFKWEINEVYDLARAELRLNEAGFTVRGINVNLQNEFQHRTVQAIGGARYHNERYKEILLELSK